MAAVRRIQKELADVTKTGLPNVSVGPAGDDLMHWQGFITGPPTSPYKGGAFKITIEFPKDYPFKPPKILFATKIYHPNIDDDGSICMGLLKVEAWKPATKLSDVLMALVQLLEEPNPDDPLVVAIAEQFKSDHAKFVKTAQEWVKKHAQK